ncbi:hypothetical protein DFH06DRAFT_225551 [Mycena polygramma]|nr:hypothetical protein DFH06DRAFT_225551 [Mycena polygramma]
MSVPIKRPPRTYGKPRDAVLDESTASLQPSGSAWSSTLAAAITAPPPLAGNLPQNTTVSRQSPALDVADDQGMDSEVDDASGGFQFSWRAKMKAMDEELSADEVDSAVPAAADASFPARHPSDTHSPTIVPNSDSSRTAPNSPSLQHSLPVDQDVFGGSLSTLTASSVASDAFNAHESHSPPASPPPIANRRRAKRRAVVHTSDEDSEEDARGTVRRSPMVPHPITTPKSRSSSTPPTSDDELPARIALTTSRSKGKGKLPVSRTQVPALQFNDEHVAEHKKRPSETLPTESKLKAPTKKDKQETVRDRGRIAVAQRAGVQRAEVSGRFNLQNFFQSVQTTNLTRTATFDDPISSFSSSPGEHRTAAVSIEPVDPVSTQLSETSAQPDIELRALDQSDDENLPDVGDLLAGVKQEKTKAERQRELMAKKQALVANQSTVYANDSEDDDLEITRQPETNGRSIVERGSASKHKPSEGRKRQLALGGVTLAQQRAKQTVTPSTPLPLNTGTRTQNQLSKDLAKLVAQSNAEATKKKEDEWVKRGGQAITLGGDGEASAALRNEALKAIAEKGRKTAEAREARMQVDFEDDDSNASDADWSEQIESANPDIQEDSNGEEEDADITMVNEDEDDEDEDEDEENQVPGQVKARGPRRARAVIDSDSENEENTAPLAKSASVILRDSILRQEDGDENEVSPIEFEAAIHRGSVSSLDERTEDEGDKENSTHLMYDRSEDKENKVIPRHSFGPRPELGRQGSLFGLEEGMRRGLSMSPGDHEPMSDGGEDENDENDAGDRRRPLQNLLVEDPFLAEPGPSQIDFAARLKQASPLSQSIDSPESTLRPSFDAAPIGAKGFSQFSDDESTSGFKGAPLQPGFSDLFESGTEQQPVKRALGLSASFSEKSQAGLFALRQKHQALGLTQDLQPAFEAGDHLKRQADAIFEKEQGFLWEAANKKSDTQKDELYVNDHGFLTQTRPDVGDPEVYKPSSPSQARSFFGTQKSGLLDPQSSLRRPLRTLSLTESVEFDELDRSPLRRLAKRTRTPSPKSTRSSPSPSRAVRAKNAFDLLRRDTLRMAPRPKKPLDKSEFVAEEAQESDDDEMLGFGKRDDGEEEDGEDMDRTLETLVDDKEMDEDMVAADRVLEKFQEHAHEDDLANEKLQQAVVQGELRKKRRNRGLGLDDSDDEDSEDENRARKIRRGMQEAKITGDVTKLAQDPQTLPFYQVFRGDLDDGDDPELAYLRQTQPEAGQEAEMESGDESEPEVITQKELFERMREVARQDSVEPAMDVDDLSWMEDGDSDGETRTKVVTRQREVRNNLVGGADRERERMNQWAKTEGRSRNAGTARASGRNAITGQMGRAKTGGGSLRTGPSGAKPEARRPVQGRPSVLATVASDRSTRFV